MAVGTRAMVVGGKSWAKALPLVDVGRGGPKPVTVIVPHYENETWLTHQLALWFGFEDAILDHLSWIVVDDGTPAGPPTAIMRSAVEYARRHRRHVNVRLFRVGVDVRWNWLAARNLGAHHAGSPWLLLTDIDHVFIPKTLEAVVYGRQDPRTVYGFARVEHTGEELQPHPNSWLMTRDLFWRVGGYDEALSGHYGTDGDWRRRMAAVAPIAIMRERLIRCEHQGDSSTRRYARKQPEDAAVKGLIAARSPKWRPLTLSFPYHEIEL